MQEKYGFVYIWRDIKHKRYYIGSHWGLETDAYKCSSPWMLNSQKRRPNDFKRRIIERHNNIKYADLLVREQLWLQLIKEEELGKKYYNLKRVTGHWAASPHGNIEMRKKLSESAKKRTKQAWTGKKHSEETKLKISQAKMGTSSPRKGKTHTEEAKAKMRANMKGRTAWNKGTKGVVKAWNKGLDKSDPRVAANIEGLMKYHQERST